MIEVLTQIAESLGGVFAEDLISKDQKKKLYDMGLVWPAYGSLFRFTPRGKAMCDMLGVRMALFNVIGEDELKRLCAEAWDSEWDKKQGQQWLNIALDTRISQQQGEPS